MGTSPANGTKYEILAAKVGRQIKAGLLLPGQPVPPIRRLMSEHGLSMGTVLKGLELLERKHVLDRHPQRGYFVSQRAGTIPYACQIAFITQALSGDTNFYLSGFSKALGHQHHSLATYSSANDQTRYRAVLDQVVKHRPAGIILHTALPPEICPIDA